MSTDSDRDDDLIENNETIKKLSVNWKLVSIMSAFINRGILEKSKLNANVTVNEKKTPILVTHVGEPIMCQPTHIDNYNIHIVKHIHRSLNTDLKYLGGSTPTPVKPMQTISVQTQRIIDHLLTGLIIINEHITNFISFDWQKLHDQKIRQVIEYLLQQRIYYLSIGQIKLKYERNT